MTDIINIYKEHCAAIFSGKPLPPPEPAWKSALMNAMTLEHCLLMGQLADIAERRFQSQASVAVVIAVLSFVAFFIKWVLA